MTEITGDFNVTDVMVYCKIINKYFAMFLPQTHYVNVVNNQQQPFHGPLIQDTPGEPVLSQRRDLPYWNNHWIFMSQMSFLPLSI